MPLLTVLALVLGFLLFGNTHHHADPLPPGVTTGWPIDPRDPEDTACGIGIHPEDTYTLTDEQLATARNYVAHTCWGAPDDGWPTNTDRPLYYHHD